MISRRFHHNLFVDVYWAELYRMFTGAGGVENKKIQFLSSLVLSCLLADWIATLAVRVGGRDRKYFKMINI